MWRLPFPQAQAAGRQSPWRCRRNLCLSAGETKVERVEERGTDATRGSPRAVPAPSGNKRLRVVRQMGAACGGRGGCGDVPRTVAQGEGHPTQELASSFLESLGRQESEKQPGLVPQPSF